MSEPSDKDLPDEQQLDEYLKGGSSVSQQYRQLHDAAVPPELDRRVLRQAQDAVKTARPAKSRVWMRWTAPLALAASAVLVVSIVIESGVQNDDLVTRTSAPAEIAAPTPMEAQRKSAATENDASATTEARSYRSPGFVPEEPRAVAEERVMQPSVPPADVTISLEAPPPPVKLETPPPDDLRRERRAPASPQAAIASSRSQAVEADKVEAEKAAQVLSRAASDSVEQTAAAEQQLMQDVQQPNAGPRNTVSAPRVMPTGAAPTSTRQKPEQAQYSDPELWLRDIRELRIQGKQEEADWEWLRFLSTFPNHVVAESDPARGLK